MEIKHDPSKGEFFKKFPDGTIAILRYCMESDNIANVLSVNVPESHSGKGIGTALTDEFFSYAKEEGFKVIPACLFVKNNYLPKRPEYSDIVVD